MLILPTVILSLQSCGNKKMVAASKAIIAQGMMKYIA